MMRHWPLRFGLLCTVGAVLLVMGCGKTEDSGLKVQAQVVQNGKPVTFQKDEEIMISFSPMDGGKTGGLGAVKADETTVTIATPKGTGIPPGKYKVSLSSQIYGGSGKDRFENAFAVERTPLTVEVGSESGQTFIVDIAKRTVQKQ